MTIMSKGKIKTPSTYGASIYFHRSVLLVSISGALVKTTTVCNIASRKTRFRIDYNSAMKFKPKPIALITL